MLKDKYKQDVIFWSLAGAVLGVVNGILTCIIFSPQLTGFVLKLVFIIFSLNCYGIAGIMLGFVWGGVFGLLGLKKIKVVLINVFLLLSLYGYLIFYTKAFTRKVDLYPSLTFTSFGSLGVAEIILVIFLSLAITFFLNLLYKRADSIQLEWKYLVIIVIGALFVDGAIWFFWGQGPKAHEVYASVPVQEDNNRQGKDNFKLPADFIPPKNLILIVIDTLRADHLGSYGYQRNTSPFMDRLAREGVLFESAITQRPKTSPSIASLFTSLYPHDHGVFAVFTNLPGEYVTLAESYRSQGFDTMSVVANANVSSTFNFDQGFMNCINTMDLAQVDTEDGKGSEDDTNQEVYKVAAEWLGQKRENPFFLYLHFIDPHGHYTPPERFDIFTSDKEVVDIRTTPFDFHLIPKYVSLIKDPSNPNEYIYDLNYYISKYDGEILYTDSLIEKVVKKLDQRKLTDDTLIVITADHGESMGEHGYFFEHGLFPFEDSVRVPFILYYPKGRFPAKTVKQPIELIDVYPTVHELMKLSYGKKKIKGQSFVSRLFGKNLFDKRAFMEAGEGSNVYLHSYAVRDERWKLIYNDWLPSTFQFFTPGFMFDVIQKVRWTNAVSNYPQWGNYELYDLENDPHETKNLYQPGSDSKLVASLMKDLGRWIKSCGNKHAQQEKIEDLDDNTKKSLKALGYIQ